VHEEIVLAAAVADGMPGGVVFRSLCASGMRVVDPLDDELLGGVPSASPLGARQEYRPLVAALTLPAGGHTEARRTLEAEAASR